MADVSVVDGRLSITLTVAESLVALHRRRIDVPIRTITEVTAVRDIMGQLRGLRMPGAGLPGRIAIGTWRGRTGEVAFRDFAIIHRRGPGVVITTAAGPFDRVLISLDEPDDLVAELRA